MLEKGDLRGLSTVVSTLLIILLVFAAIAIVWVVIKNIIVNQSEIAEKQRDFFSESIRIVNLRINKSLVNMSLERIGGGEKPGNKTVENLTTEEIMEADIISVVDLSGSMRSCHNVSQTCCQNTLRGEYTPIHGSSSGYCDTLNSNQNTTCISTCYGTWVDRISAAKEANKELINVILQTKGSRIGFVGYDTSVINSASIDLTDDATQLNNTINSWDVGQSTCICCGINEALNRLQQQSSDDRLKKIIVMSDGDANVRCHQQNTPNATQDAIKASCDAKNSLGNLTIYAIGLGEDVDEQTLTGISNCGVGKYFSAINVTQLIDVYKSVAYEIKSTSVSIQKFNYLYIVFYNGTSSYREKTFEIPDVAGIKAYKFNLTGNLEGNITKIEVYPVILSDSGKEIIGPVFDRWESTQ